MVKWSAGKSPWEEWHHRAVAAGVSAGLAVLGREVIRAAHETCDEYQIRRCGSADDGAEMIVYAKREPDRSRRAWTRILLGLDERPMSVDDVLAALSGDDG